MCEARYTWGVALPQVGIDESGRSVITPFPSLFPWPKSIPRNSQSWAGGSGCSPHPHHTQSTAAFVGCKKQHPSSPVTMTTLRIKNTHISTPCSKKEISIKDGIHLLHISVFLTRKSLGISWLFGVWKWRRQSPHPVLTASGLVTPLLFLSSLNKVSEFL